MRKTKIICTLGPATDHEETLRAMAKAGMDVARINFSHGTHEQQLSRIKMLKKIREELGLPIALLADTKGPEIRLGEIENGIAELVTGQTFVLTTRPCVGDGKRAYITDDGLPQDVARGTHILIDDGLIDMVVISVTNTDITCQVVNGGEISSKKGVNVPGVSLSLPYISAADRSDLRFIAENDFDFLAASFVRTAADVHQIKSELDRINCHDLRIIAKIENAEGVVNIDEIIEACDGVMVARGDMGVEVPLEEGPVVQKKLIKKAYSSGKQVITATQMLESMIHHPRPTRAETTDVANAIYDGTSAIMLSGETAAGAYPVGAVKTMSIIAERTERDIDYKKRFRIREGINLCNVTDALAHATCAAAHDLSAAAVVTVSKSGVTARNISKYRPACSIIGCSPDPKVVRQMNLSWGVSPLLMEEKQNTDDLFNAAVDICQNAKLVQDGDLVVITAGIPLAVSGTTNMMKVHVVGDVFQSGKTP